MGWADEAERVFQAKEDEAWAAKADDEEAER